MRTLHALLAAGLLSSLGLATSTSAAIFYQDNFNTYADNSNMNGQGGWGATDTVAQSAVAVGGNAARIGNGPTAPSGGQMTRGAPLFSLTRAQQTVEFDFRLEETISDFVGTPNLDLQDGFLFRGNAANKQFSFVYKANTNGLGAISQDGFEFRMNGSAVSNRLVEGNILSDTWYHIRMELDFTANTLDGIITRGGTVFFNPGPLSTFQPNGNVNNLTIDADGSPDKTIFLDNFVVFIPEPASLALLAPLGIAMLRRHRR